MMNKKQTKEWALGIAVQAWRTPKTKKKQMDSELAEAFANIILAIVHEMKTKDASISIKGREN